MIGLKLCAAVMVTGGTTVTASALAVLQAVTRPEAVVLDEGSLVPVGLAVTALVATVGCTIVVVRWIDRVNRKLRHLEKAGLLPPEDEP